MNYKQADIVLLPFPYSDLSAAKKRPALVLSNNNFNSASADIICCLITANPRTDSLSVPITDADVYDGKLIFNSRIKPYRVFTVHTRIVLKKLCSLKNAKLEIVIKRLIDILSEK